MSTKLNLLQYLRTETIHNSPKYAEPAAQIIAKQWKHHDFERKQNLRSMLEDSRDKLPCHLALILNLPGNADIDNLLDASLKASCPVNEDVVVGHVKLAKADGRSDGACCISYSLVVDDIYRGFGFGRVLTEEAENYARSIGLSYMYLSTNDKVSFYEHLGYKQCEAVSSLGSNSKRLNATQVSALEGLFAKRLNVANPCNCNTWLRKRLIESYQVEKPIEPSAFLSMLAKSVSDLTYEQSIPTSPLLMAYYIPFYWQQQTGPSCGISAMNMVDASIKHKLQRQNTSVLCLNCTKSVNQKEVINESSPLSVALNSGTSNEGELFCAFNFTYVCEKSLGLHTRVVDDWSFDDVFNELKWGYPVIIPYDRNLSDHKPGNFNGSQAHWAVIVGFVSGEETSCTEVLSGAITLDVKVGKSVIVGTEIANDIGDHMNYNEETLVICVHGMSKKPFVCSVKALFESNRQLMNSKSKFYLASEDLYHLRDKIIVIDHP